MAEAVYLLCAVTSIACAALLWRGFLDSRTKLLFWSSLCFVIFAVNNVLLFIDLVIVPTVDLSLLRNGTSLLAMFVLVHGLVWESR